MQDGRDSEKGDTVSVLHGERIGSRSEQVSREMRAEGYRLPTLHLLWFQFPPEAVPQGRFGGHVAYLRGSPEPIGEEGHRVLSQ